MRYAYKDLGRQEGGTTVTVRLEGSSANVLLLDEENFHRYRGRRGFRYTGGLRSSPSVNLSIPRDGHWYLVLDMGGFRGRVRGHIQRIAPPRRGQRRSPARRREAHR